MKRKSIIAIQYPTFREETDVFNLNIIKDTFNTDVIPDEIDVDKPDVYILYFYNMHLVADIFPASGGNYSEYTNLLFNGISQLKSLYTVDRDDGDYITVRISKSITNLSIPLTALDRNRFILRANVARLIP